MSARFVLPVVVCAVLMSLAATARGDSGTYVDDDRSRYEGFIETASAEGIVTGCNPPANDRFCPHSPVTRAQLAVMLARGLGLGPSGSDRFVDDADHPAEEAINALGEAGVTRGCSSDRFCPDRALTRGETAAMIARAFDWTDSDDYIVRYLDLKGSAYAAPVAGLAFRGGLDACDPPEGRRLCPDRLVTRDEAVFALATALGLNPLRRSQSHPGPTVGFVDSFDDLDLWDGRSPGSRNRVSLTGSGFRHDGLRVDIPRGSHYGADFRLDLSEAVGEESETLFFRYYLRLDRGWSPKASGKLPGFSGVYGASGKGGRRSSASSPGWSARMQFFGTRPEDPRARLGYYVYHLGQERQYGDGMMWNEAGKLQPGEWYCIEGQVQLNTPGIADGALRGWVDGTPAFEAAGIEFRRPDEPRIKIESFWFNVYYGGKPTANTDLGLTVDEVAVDGERVGCGAGSGLRTRASGDLNGNGFAENLWWGSCPTGPCFQSQVTTEKGKARPAAMGNGAWFSLETHRLGVHLADVDGDGDADVIYRGRCDRSEPCWRVHRTFRSGLGRGENWGDGAWLAGKQVVVGDWDGDGLADLTYPGRCGDGQHCWRVHRSTGREFAPPGGWGQPPAELLAAPVAADMTGDGLDDIVYAAPCKSGQCWWMQASEGDRFGDPRVLGKARAAELERMWLFDENGDGRSDVVTARPTDSGGARIEMRVLDGDSLSEPRSLAATQAPLEDILLRRRPSDGMVEALVMTACEARPVCTERFLAVSGRLITPGDYALALTREAVRDLTSERDRSRPSVE